MQRPLIYTELNSSRGNAFWIMEARNLIRNCLPEKEVVNDIIQSGIQSNKQEFMKQKLFERTRCLFMNSQI
jgi:predicted KAP-like P-loop ATPase